MIALITVIPVLILSIFYISYFALMYRKSRGSKLLHNVVEENCIPSVTVIVPAYNEENNIATKLEDLAKQNYPKMEIIVVNDGSTDSTEEIARSAIDRNLKEIESRLITYRVREGKPSALNRARLQSNGDVLIITDADTTLGEHAIRETAKNFADPQIGAVTGKMQMVNYKQSSVTKLEESYRTVFDMIRIGESNIDSTPIFNGPLVALRRTLFDPLDSNSIADDTEISMMIREKGYRAVFEPRATVYALTPKSMKNRIKQKIRRAQGIIQSFRRHKKILFDQNYGKYGLIVFPCEFFMTLVSPILLALIAALLIIATVIDPITMGSIAVITCSGVVIWQMIVYFLRRILKRSTLINPLKLFASFLEAQIILLVGLFFAIFKKTDVKWERVAD